MTYFPHLLELTRNSVRSGLLSFPLFSLIRANIRDIAGLVSEHCNKVTIPINQIIIFLLMEGLAVCLEKRNTCEVQ